MKIFFQTHGCSTNFSESEVMMGLLAKAGFELGTIEESEAVVVNVCTVKGEGTAFREIKEIKEKYPHKKLVVAGCLTPKLIRGIRGIDENAGLISTHNIDKIVEVVENTVHNTPIEAISESRLKKISMPKLRRNPVIGIVPILSGCNHNCTYCSVKLIKGNVDSYPIEEILSEVRKAVAHGCKEIWVTSQDNAAYMMEHGKSELANLLNQILAVSGDFKVRLGMMNPINAGGIIDELIAVYKHEKMFKFFHLPVQSGNDEILKKMNRNYTVNEFKEIVRKIKGQIPNLTLSTDIIVGFPGETEEQFNDSLELIKDITPDVLNISRFQAREGTAAALIEGQVSGGIAKERSRKLTDLFSRIAYMQNEKWYDWKGLVLIDEKGKDNTWIGRNFAYKPVIVAGDYMLGQIIKVKINRITSIDLRGEIV